MDGAELLELCQKCIIEYWSANWSCTVSIQEFRRLFLGQNPVKMRQLLSYIFLEGSESVTACLCIPHSVLVRHIGLRLNMLECVWLCDLCGLIYLIYNALSSVRVVSAKKTNKQIPTNVNL